jgi:hypothetical protein
MPSFDDHIGDVFDKSWAVYSELHGPRTFTFDCEKGRELTLSVSKPVGAAGSATAEVDLEGATCAHGFNGWGRRLLDLPGVAQDTHFEPFGVGGYVSLAACKSTCPDSASHTLTVTGTAHMPFTIGAGMTESFTAGELILMSFTLRRVFTWTGQSPLWLSLGVLGTLFLTGLGTLWRNMSRLATPWRAAALAGAVALRVSAGIFSAQLAYLAVEGVTFDGMLAVPLVMHIAVPVLLSAVVEWRARRVLRGRNTQWLFSAIALYSLFAAWQGYLIPTIALILAAFVPYSPKYSVVTP